MFPSTVSIPVSFHCAATLETEATTQEPSEPAAMAPMLPTMPSAGMELSGQRELLSPAERRAILGRGPMSPQERIEAMIAARRKQGLPIPGDRASMGVDCSVGPSPRPALTRIHLDAEASQLSTGPQVGALFGEIIIDTVNLSEKTEGGVLQSSSGMYLPSQVLCV